MAVWPVQMERKVDAQPLKQWAFTEVAEPCMGLVFIISIMAAVFNIFVFLDHFQFFCFGFFLLFFFVVCNFFHLSKWTGLTELCCRHYKLLSHSCHFSCQWLLHMLTSVLLNSLMCAEWTGLIRRMATISSALLMPNSSNCPIVRKDIPSHCLPATKAVEKSSTL